MVFIDFPTAHLTILKGVHLKAFKEKVGEDSTIFHCRVNFCSWALFPSSLCVLQSNYCLPEKYHPLSTHKLHTGEKFGDSDPFFSENGSHLKMFLKCFITSHRKQAVPSVLCVYGTTRRGKLFSFYKTTKTQKSLLLCNPPRCGVLCVNLQPFWRQNTKSSRIQTEVYYLC